MGALRPDKLKNPLNDEKSSEKQAEIQKNSAQMENGVVFMC